MKAMKKYILSLLTLLPIKSIATVAQSAVLDAAGEEQKSLLLNQLNKSRSLIMPKGVYSTTIEEAKARLKGLTGISNENELDAEITKHIEILQKNGILIMNEGKIVSGAPSLVGL
ncbi:MAG: hypothetical protein ACXVCY_08640 [Pseudobdellovibrionaceae bacterium]